MLRTKAAKKTCESRLGLVSGSRTETIVPWTHWLTQLIKINVMRPAIAKRLCSPDVDKLAVARMLAESCIRVKGEMSVRGIGFLLCAVKGCLIFWEKMKEKSILKTIFQVISVLFHGRTKRLTYGWNFLV